ncbi:hypothetical protein LTR56_021425 [Elasticomyces elasticus]|nr:hypothetical protein LTR56_021425 [Elasticomyces elasticus]KAK3624671.1 hypothetical protein LTR22_023865 [Elasticomyces elasticus]KAK4907142.1 hypothetical protein LTR49_023789 [Elasticomyces elasticus]KAK5754284.1 hypothetical protein LTS12_015575 [Elasticomyces elasticus]
MPFKLCSFVYRSYGLSILLTHALPATRDDSPAKSKAMLNALEELDLENLPLRLHDIHCAIAEFVRKRVVNL